MSFHAPKNKKTFTIDLNSGNVILEVYKSIVIEMKKRGATDEELETFASNPRPESLGLKPDPYRDAMFIQIKERTTQEDRYKTLVELVAQGKL